MHIFFKNTKDPPCISVSSFLLLFFPGVSFVFSFLFGDFPLTGSLIRYSSSLSLICGTCPSSFLNNLLRTISSSSFLCGLSDRGDSDPDDNAIATAGVYSTNQILIIMSHAKVSTISLTKFNLL